MDAAEGPRIEAIPQPVSVISGTDSRSVVRDACERVGNPFKCGSQAIASSLAVQGQFIQTLGLLVSYHGATHRQYKRHRYIDPQVRSALGRIQVATSVRLADHIANAPRQYWVPFMVLAAGPHCGV
jgi:hypothetical protein